MKHGMKVIASIKDGTQTPPPGIITLDLARGLEWIQSFEPGKVTAKWTVDPRYYNLEGAVIAGWLACLAEQVTFYATNTLIDENEVTRTVDLRLTYIENVIEGDIAMEAHVEKYEHQKMWVEVRFYLPDGSLATKASSVVEVQRVKS